MAVIAAGAEVVAVARAVRRTAKTARALRLTCSQIRPSNLPNSSAPRYALESLES